jgi:hypothetical protein
MRAFVEAVAGSRYAPGLFPVQSMHTLRLFQQDHFSFDDDQIKVNLEDGEFVVRYSSGGASAPAWTKRAEDGFAALERCLEHLRWFVEYHE